MKTKILFALLNIFTLTAAAQNIAADEMKRIYEEVKTPYKYGMVVVPADNYHKIDCPTVFQENGKWYMTYVVYNGKEGTDGRGYETWLAESEDLLSWKTLGRLLSYKNEGWDMNQRGGFPALIDWTWNGDYHIGTFKGKHWMTYIGGHGTGYEAVKEPLNIGIAWTQGDITKAHEWQSADKPLLNINDKDAQWWEKLVQYKSTIYEVNSEKGKVKNLLPPEITKYRFVMFYNAGGVNPENNLKAERIGIALSNDLKKWKRFDGNPVFANEVGGIITGDAQIAKMGDLYVMFYFMAYDPSRKYNAFNTFAVSRDLIHWQRWEGKDLIWPTKKYDEMFAHKSYVVKHDGVVYHFYCAVNNDGQRGIALATSIPMGRSSVRFPTPEPKGKRRITGLNNNWRAKGGTVNLPHNFDDYYGYRQFRHGNLHGSASYQKTFETEKRDGKCYFLQFEGVGTYATVTLNGHQYPRELVGRTVWTLDITDAIRNGQNDLKVFVDHPAMQTECPWVCGGCSSEYGFSEGSQPFGIFRPVTLIETDEIRIEPFGVHIWNNQACDSVFIETEIKNYTTASQTIELVNKFTLASGKQVFRLVETATLAPGETKIISQSSAIADVHRWSISDPYLYHLSTMLKREGKTTDDLTTPFGIRSIAWPRFGSPDHRFYLNNVPTFINGTCEYEHLLGNSHAFTHEQIASRIKQIHNAGFNAMREAHQPHNLYYQQLTDERGLLFWSQFSAHIWYDTPQFRENFKRLLVRWIKERRNSPSVILWGLQNESVLPKDFAEECSDIIRSLDPTASTMRLITTCNGGEGTDWNVIQNWSGTYGGNAENYDKELQRDDQLLNGEYGAWRTIDLHGDAKYSEESFTELLDLKAHLAEKAFADTTGQGVCGHFQWLFTSHDNPGRTQPDGALRRIDKIGPINYKGLTTIWEEPTPAYYMYRQHASLFTSHAPLPTAADRNIDLVKGAEGYHYLYRINCGGDAYTDEFGQHWLADDSLYSHSWGQDFGLHPFQASQRHISDDIRGTKSDELFQFFRFGRHRLWYDFPLPDGEYRIELYFAEPWHGKSAGNISDDYEGLRIFDIAVNGKTVIDDLDPWAEAGYCGAMKRVITAKAENGHLRISFPEVKAGQAIIAAIAIASLSDKSDYSEHSEYSEKSKTWRSFDTDTIAKLPASELPQDIEARPATIYEPQKAKKGQPVTFIIKPGLGQEYALRFRYKNTTGTPVKARMTLTDSKRIVLVDKEISFPTTPNKFKMLSTTTGTQINAGTYTLKIEAPDIEFKDLEIQ
jgi:predicted GH43/DUF377 family glycosyl hydrolase